MCLIVFFFCVVDVVWVRGAYDAFEFARVRFRIFYIDDGIDDYCVCFCKMGCEIFVIDYWCVFFGFFNVNDCD